MKTLRNLKNNSGVTLLELLIGISMMTMVIFAGSSMYLSGMSLSVDAQESAQAHRNAQILLMHIEKYVQDAATNFKVLDAGNNVVTLGTKVVFKTYNAASPDFSNPPSISKQYTFNTTAKTVTYSSGSETIIFRHISGCTFEANELGLKINITALNNKDNNASSYELKSNISAGLTAYPNVYSA